MRLQGREHMVIDQGFHLKRNTRQGDHYPPVVFKPHARSGAIAVGQYPGFGGQQGLFSVLVVDGCWDILPKHFLYRFQDLRVEHQFIVEIGGQGVFGQIVFGGAKPSGN